MSVDFEVFIIGAGPAGLPAAYCLTQKMDSVAVIEKDQTYVGGISRTVRYKNFLFDIGGHRFFSKAKEVMDLWREILPDDFIERPRLSRIFYEGKFYSYPLNAFEALTNLGVVRSAACMLSFAYAKAFPIHDPASFHDWVRNQFGERLFSIFFKTYTEKVWGLSCDSRRIGRRNASRGSISASPSSMQSNGRSGRLRQHARRAARWSRR
jgi:protoporphyrinogen oxidase